MCVWRLPLLAAACVCPTTVVGDTGRDLLFHDAAAVLPDVIISDSVKHVKEGDAFSYTVQLSHAPGMREDATIDLRNDEVRVYLTSSQEVYQQDDEDANTVAFQQFVGHRTQLSINTNVKYNGAADPASPQKWTGGDVAKHTLGPLPYTYVAYSSVDPTQRSPRLQSVTGANYKVVCPLCSHPAYCRMKAGTVIPGTKSNTYAASISGSKVVITSGTAGSSSTSPIYSMPARSLGSGNRRFSRHTPGGSGGLPATPSSRRTSTSTATASVLPPRIEFPTQRWLETPGCSSLTR
jgi:hypothetical protein